MCTFVFRKRSGTAPGQLCMIKVKRLEFMGFSLHIFLYKGERNGLFIYVVQPSQNLVLLWLMLNSRSLVGTIYFRHLSRSHMLTHNHDHPGISLSLQRPKYAINRKIRSFCCFLAHIEIQDRQTTNQSNNHSSIASASCGAPPPIVICFMALVNSLSMPCLTASSTLSTVIFGM